MRVGSEEVQFAARTRPIDGVNIITKRCVNSLVGTQLHRVLARYGCHRLVLAGIAADHLVESTARCAADYGYRAVVLSDCCASATGGLNEYPVARILRTYAGVVASDESMGLSATMSFREER
jgi:nicotinamidase-related amidase